MYEINILPEPEIFNGKAMYFWHIARRAETGSVNCGHGWAASVGQAAEDASRYYIENVKNA